MKKRLPEWLRKLFYEWSNHVKVERALRDRHREGIKIGEGHTPPPIYKTVVHLQNCNKHGIPLIEREHEPGVFDCPVCRQFSGPMQPYRPGQLMLAMRERLKQEQPELTVDTQKINAIMKKNLTQKLKPFPEES